MPQARRTFQRFWDSISPRPEPEILSDYLQGTLDNADLSSIPAITDVARIGDDVVISFTTLSGENYSLQSANDLTHPAWAPIAGTIAGTGGIVQIVEPAPVSHTNGFYRVVRTIGGAAAGYDGNPHY